jgi:type III secretory pathway component EscS
VIVVTSVASLAVAIGFAVPRIRDHRLAFWIPLVAGAASAFVTIVLVAAAILADPAYLDSVRHATATP